VAIDPKNLPKDPEILQQIVVDLTRQLDKSQRLLQQLLTTRSGTRSEQLSADQLRLFVQQIGIELPHSTEAAEQTANEEDDDDEPPPAANGSDSSAGKKRGRQALPGHLKRERLVHDLAEQDKHCAECDQDLRHIGEEVSERYNIFRHRCWSFRTPARSMPAPAR
jgi:transposase